MPPKTKSSKSKVVGERLNFEWIDNSCHITSVVQLLCCAPEDRFRNPDEGILHLFKMVKKQVPSTPKQLASELQKLRSSLPFSQAGEESAEEALTALLERLGRLARVLPSG